MHISEVYTWLVQSERRKKLLLRFSQPFTAKQLSHREDFTLDACSHILNELSIYKVVYCLNPSAKRSRLYWLTELGKVCQRRVRQNQHLPVLEHFLPNVDWELYGWVCYTHRAAIIKVLTKELQPSAIKRKATFQNPKLRMSANNVRDVIRLFLAKGIVSAVRIRGLHHLRYELTKTGKQLQVLLRKSLISRR